jgi:two-component system sensor histidine kinase BarA
LCELVHKLNGGASYCGLPLLKDTLCLLEKALHHSDFVINVVLLEKYKQFLEVCDKTMQAYQQQYNEGVE